MYFASYLDPEFIRTVGAKEKGYESFCTLKISHSKWSNTSHPSKPSTFQVYIPNRPKDPYPDSAALARHSLLAQHDGAAHLFLQIPSSHHPHKPSGLREAVVVRENVHAYVHGIAHAHTPASVV